jgi:hypothetical protein
MVGPAVKRAAVAHLQARMGLSERRACQIVGADRKMIRYRSIRPPETELRQRLRDLANERRRFGYRRLFILLRREGEPSGINRIYRLYREEGLAVRKRRARRKAIGTRAPILVEARPNARWSLDFVHDQLANRLRIERGADLAGWRSELERVDRELDKMVDAILQGFPPAKLKDKAEKLEARKAELTELLDNADEPPPLLHPNMARMYQDRIAKLCENLQSEEDRGAAVDVLRSLVDEISQTIPARGRPKSKNLRGRTGGGIASIVGCGGRI